MSTAATLPAPVQTQEEAPPTWKLKAGLAPDAWRWLDIRYVGGSCQIAAQFWRRLQSGIPSRHTFRDVPRAVSPDEIAQREAAIREELAKDPAVIQYRALQGELKTLEQRAAETRERVESLEGKKEKARATPTALPKILLDLELARVQLRHIEASLDMYKNSPDGTAGPLQQARGPALNLAHAAASKLRSEFRNRFVEEENRLAAELETVAAPILSKLAANRQAWQDVLRDKGAPQRLFEP